MQDAETGRKMLVDTSSRAVRENLERAAQERRQKLENTFMRAGVQDVAIANGDDYVKPLIKLFKSR
jgi:hypothetical protein